MGEVEVKGEVCRFFLVRCWFRSAFLYLFVPFFSLLTAGLHSLQPVTPPMLAGVGLTSLALGIVRNIPSFLRVRSLLGRGGGRLVGKRLLAPYLVDGLMVVASGLAGRMLGFSAAGLLLLLFAAWYAFSSFLLQGLLLAALHLAVNRRGKTLLWRIPPAGRNILHKTYTAKIE